MHEAFAETHAGAAEAIAGGIMKSAVFMAMMHSGIPPLMVIAWVCRLLIVGNGVATGNWLTVAMSGSALTHGMPGLDDHVAHGFGGTPAKPDMNPIENGHGVEDAAALRISNPEIDSYIDKGFGPELALLKEREIEAEKFLYYLQHTDGLDSQHTKDIAKLVNYYREMQVNINNLILGDYKDYQDALKAAHDAAGGDVNKYEALMRAAGQERIKLITDLQQMKVVTTDGVNQPLYLRLSDATQRVLDAEYQKELAFAREHANDKGWYVNHDEWRTSDTIPRKGGVELDFKPAVLFAFNRYDLAVGDGFTLLPSEGSNLSWKHTGWAHEAGVAIDFRGPEDAASVARLITGTENIPGVPADMKMTVLYEVKTGDLAAVQKSVMDELTRKVPYVDAEGVSHPALYGWPPEKAAAFVKEHIIGNPDASANHYHWQLDQLPPQCP